MAERQYDRNFEMAHSIMHVAGQSYTQSFSGSGPNALDRGIEALAYSAIAMSNVAPKAEYHRNFGRDQVALEKTYTLVPRGVSLVICCASFPTWNAYPALKKLGLDYETLGSIKSDIILTTGSAFGSTGPYATRGGFDTVAQAMSGGMYLYGTPANRQNLSRRIATSVLPR